MDREPEDDLSEGQGYLKDMKLLSLQKTYGKSNIYSRELMYQMFKESLLRLHML